MPKYFVFDRNDFQTFDTADEAKTVAENILAQYSDEAAEESWHPDVESLCWGEIREQVTEVSRIERPPDDELEEGYDRDGNCWSDDWDSIVDYKLKPVDAEAEVSNVLSA